MKLNETEPSIEKLVETSTSDLSLLTKVKSEYLPDYLVDVFIPFEDNIAVINAHKEKRRRNASRGNRSVKNKTLECESSLKATEMGKPGENSKYLEKDKNFQDQIDESEAENSAVDTNEDVESLQPDNLIENNQNMYSNLEKEIPITKTLEDILTKYKFEKPGILNLQAISNSYIRRSIYAEPQNIDDFSKEDDTMTDVSALRTNDEETTLNAAKDDDCLNTTLHQANIEDGSKNCSENRNSDENNDVILTTEDKSTPESNDKSDKSLVVNVEKSSKKRNFKCKSRGFPNQQPPRKRNKTFDENLKLELNASTENSFTPEISRSSTSFHNSSLRNAATSSAFQSGVETSLNRNENNESKGAEVIDVDVKPELYKFTKLKRGRRKKRESINPFVRPEAPQPVNQVFPLQRVVKVEQNSFIEKRKPHRAVNRVNIDEETCRNMLFAAPGDASNSTTSTTQLNRSTSLLLTHKNEFENESLTGLSGIQKKNRTAAGYQNIFDMFSEDLDQPLDQETANNESIVDEESAGVEEPSINHEIKFENCEPEFINGTVFSNYLQNTLEIFEINQASSPIIDETYSSVGRSVQNDINDHVPSPDILPGESYMGTTNRIIDLDGINDSSNDWHVQPNRTKSIPTTSKKRSSKRPTKKFKLLSRRKRRLQRAELKKKHLKYIKKLKKKPFFEKHLLNQKLREKNSYRKRRKLACLRQRHFRGAPITYNYEDNFISGSLNLMLLPFQEIKMNNHNIYVKPSFYGVPLMCDMNNIFIDPLDCVCIEQTPETYNLSAFRCCVYDWRRKRNLSSPDYNVIFQYGKGSFVVELCEDPSDAERLKSIEPSINDTFLKVCTEVDWRDYRKPLSRQLCILHNRLRVGHCGKYRHLVFENWVLEGFRIQADIVLSPKFLREKNIVSKLPITLIRMTRVNDPKDYSLPKSADDIMCTFVETLKLDLYLTKTDLFPHVYIFNRYTGLNPYKREEKNDYLREMADIRRGVSNLLEEGNPCTTDLATDNEIHREALKHGGRLSQLAVEAMNRLDLTIHCNQKLACRPIVVEEAYSREVVNVISSKDQKATPPLQNRFISFNPTSYESYIINNNGIVKALKPTVPIISQFAKISHPDTLRTVRRFLPSESEEGIYDLTSEKLQIIKPQNRATGIVMEPFGSCKASIPTKPLELFKSSATTGENRRVGSKLQKKYPVFKKVQVIRRKADLNSDPALKPFPRSMKSTHSKLPITVNFKKVPVKLVKKITNPIPVKILSKTPTSSSNNSKKITTKKVLKVIPVKSFVNKSNNTIQKVIHTSNLQDLKIKAVSKELTEYLKVTSDAGCLVPGSLDVKLAIVQILVDHQLGLKSYHEMTLFLEKNRFSEIASEYFRVPLMRDRILFNFKRTQKKKTYQIRDGIFQLNTEPQFKNIKSCTDLFEVTKRSEGFLREAIERYKRRNGLEEDDEIKFDDHPVVEILSLESDFLPKKRKHKRLSDIEEQNKRRAEQNRQNAEKKAFDNLSKVLTENEFLHLVTIAVKCMLKSNNGRLPLLGIMYSAILAIRDLHCIFGPLLLHRSIAEDRNLKLRLKLKQLEEEASQLKSKNLEVESTSNEIDTTQQNEGGRINVKEGTDSQESKNEEEIVNDNIESCTEQLDLGNKEESPERNRVGTVQDILIRFHNGFPDSDSPEV